MNNSKEKLAKELFLVNKLIKAEESQENKSSMYCMLLAQRDLLNIRLNTNRAERRKNFKKLFVGK